MNVLSVSNLSVSYDGSRILRNVTLSVPENRVVCLMGRNGVGKTTTLKAIAGIAACDDGEITLNDQSATRMKPDQRARHGLSYVPQGRDIFPNLTVHENLKLSLVVHRKKPSRTASNGTCHDTGSSMERVLELFPILKGMLRRKGGVLSGGQQQQLAIARAMLTDPKALMLDEPTEGIQPNIIDQIAETIIKIKAEGQISILLVEQYLEFCLSVGDSFYIMDRGAIVADGPISDLNNDLVKEHLTV